MKHLFHHVMLFLLFLLGGVAVSIHAETKDPALFATIEQSGTRVIINGTGVRLRLGPGKQYDYYSNALKKGSSWPYVGTYGDWYAINVNGGIYYVSARYSYLQTPRQQSRSYVVINGTGVRLRLGPGKQYDYYSGALAKGSYWPYVGTYGNWYAINYHGSVYYVSRDYSYIR